MKTIFCHYCGKQIVWNRTWPDPRNSHWAHAILVHNGKEHTLENALMNQQCSDGKHYATPKRAKSKAAKCHICGVIIPDIRKEKAAQTCDDCQREINQGKRAEYCDMCGIVGGI